MESKFAIIDPRPYAEGSEKWEKGKIISEHETLEGALSRLKALRKKAQSQKGYLPYGVCELREGKWAPV